MAFRLAPWAFILLLSYSLVTIVNPATTNPPTSVRFFNDPDCKSLFATVQTAANVRDGQCGILPPGISSASAVFLDEGCFVTIYTDDCNDGATAVRLNECAALRAASFSIDCPGINGTFDPGYTTSIAGGVPSTTSATPVVLPTDQAKSSVVALGSTTAPEQGQSSVTNIPGPSSARNPSSTPSSFTTSTSTPATLSPASQSSTISPLTSPSSSRNSQPSLQPSSSSPSPSPSTQAQPGPTNNSSLNAHTKLILATVLPIAGILTIALILVIFLLKHPKKPPPSIKESDSSSSNPIPNQPPAELDGDRGGELDASPTSGDPELGSREVYEMESRRGARDKELGIQELNGDAEHPKELD